MSADLQTELLQLFERHDVPLEPDEDWLLTDGDFPAIRASWHAGKAAGERGRLDIDLVLDEERQIELSYAGEAPDGHDALARFARSDLPVLLAACWYVTDERKLDLAQWEIGLRSWDAFIGRFTVEGAEINVPSGVVAALAAALQGAPLAPQPHWIRLFLRHGADGAPVTEMLLDNEPWPAGDRALAALPWPPGAYVVRGLILLDVRDY